MRSQSSRSSRSTSEQLTPAALRAQHLRLGIIAAGVLVFTGIASSPWWYPALDRYLKLQHIEALYAADPEEATRLIQLLHEAYPESQYLLSRYAYHNAEDLNNGRELAVKQYLHLLEAAPLRWREDPWVVKHLTASLAWMPPTPAQQPYRNLMVLHYGEALKPMLLSQVYIPGADSRILRRNAFLMLDTMNAEELDLLRFFSLELFEDTPAGDAFQVRALDYFSELLEGGVSPELATKAQQSLSGRNLERIPILEQLSPQAERAVPVLEAFFADVIKPVLLQAFPDPGARGLRLLGWPIAQARGWVSPVLEWEYQRANLLDYDPAEAAVWVLDAVAYFDLKAGAGGGWEALDAMLSSLDKVDSGTAAVIKTGTPANQQYTLAQYVQLNARVRSLRHRIRARR